MCHELENGEPDADILGALRHRSPRLADELLGVEADLHPVVEQREEGRQGEGRHEDRQETELQNCEEKVSDIESRKDWFS